MRAKPTDPHTNPDGHAQLEQNEERLAALQTLLQAGGTTAYRQTLYSARQTLFQQTSAVRWE